MKYYKLVVGVLAVAILSVWGYLVFDINRAYPSPEEKIYKINDTFDYYGLYITPKSIEIYNREEMYEKYQGLEESGVLVNEEDYLYAIVTVHIKNTNTNAMDTKDNPITYWMIETGMATTGMSQELAYVVDFSSEIFDVGFECDVEIPFSICKPHLDGKSEEEILEQGIKIVADYYPYKKYILFQE